MLSVVMCSRNDDYGIGLHQRTALSLNCWGTQLSLGDEIIFIDDNTIGKPTLLEAVWEFLHPRAKRLIRGLRVFPELHDSWGVKTPVAEMHCRNIGIRQARNPWVITTTNDNFPLYLYPHVLDLTPGFWASWVQKIPDTFWRGFVAADPLLRSVAMMDGFFMRHKGARPAVIHPKAGDMLIGAKDSFERVGGFEEGMIGHGGGEAALLKKAVDLGVPTSSCLGMISVFHLEHGQNHFQDETEKNDLTEWVDELEGTRNSATWGQYPVEEIRL